jgi:excisionase family DNA binding protein
METAPSRHTRPEPLEPVLTLSELADRLHVPVQTLYDLRSHGRGPRGFRVGRELRFRASEIEVWLARMEADDAARHRAVHRDTA